jgi:hypothetical protein
MMIATRITPRIPSPPGVSMLSATALPWKTPISVFLDDIENDENDREQGRPQATPRNKRANSPPVIASAAKQSSGGITRPLDCFVARAPRNDGRGISVQSIR